MMRKPSSTHHSTLPPGKGHPGAYAGGCSGEKCCKPDDGEGVIKSTGITTYAPRDQRGEEAGPLGRTEECSHTTREVLAPMEGLQC